MHKVNEYKPHTHKHKSPLKQWKVIDPSDS